MSEFSELAREFDKYIRERIEDGQLHAVERELELSEDEDFKEAIRIILLKEALIDDCKKSFAELKQDFYNQFKRRSYVHFLFALIDGYFAIINKLSLYVYSYHGSSNIHFSEEEIALLKGGKYGSFGQNLKFTFKTNAAVLRKEFSLNLNCDQQWKLFLNAIKIRHRITHPKDIRDIEVSDEDLAVLSKALHWYFDLIDRLLHASEHV